MITFSEAINAAENKQELENLRLKLKVGQNIMSLLEPGAQVNAVKLMHSDAEKYKPLFLERKRPPVADLMTELATKTQTND